MTAYDYYRQTFCATAHQVREIKRTVRDAMASGDTSLLVAWNIWLCDALDVAETIAASRAQH